MNTELYGSMWPFVAGGLLCIGLVVVGIAGAKFKSWWAEKRKTTPAGAGPTRERKREPIPARRTTAGAGRPQATPPKTNDVKQNQRHAADFVPPMTDYLLVPHDPGFTRKEEDELLVLYGNRKQRKAAKARQLQRMSKPAATQPVHPLQDSQPRESQSSRETERGLP